MTTTNNYTHVCERCGNPTNKPVFVNCGNFYNEIWCTDCAETHAQRCDRCGGYTTRGTTNIVTPNGAEHWCPTCTRCNSAVCADCGTRYSTTLINERRVSGRGWQWLCNDCVSVYSTCANCGQLCPMDEISYVRGQAWCTDCVSQMGSVHGYHHTDAYMFIDDGGNVTDEASQDGKGRELLYMGVELETDENDDRDRLARNVFDAVGDCMECKRDGSLSCRGLEIVSQPFGLYYHTSGIWETIVNLVRDENGLSDCTNTCGLHVHSNRGFFGSQDESDNAALRIDSLFSRFTDEMVRFTRRDYEQLEQWADMPRDYAIPHDENKAQRIRKYKRIKADDGRYVAVNIRNDATIELRLFRGSLNIETLYATFEFVAGLMHVARDADDTFIDSCTWSDLIDAIRDKVPDHRALDSYLSRRGI